MIVRDETAPGWMTATWLAALVLLPLTTPGFLPLGQTLVRPPSVLLFGLIAAGALAYGATRRRLLADRGVQRLLLFAGWTLCAGIWLALRCGEPAFKGAHAGGLFARAALTLASGAACYIAARTMLRSAEDVRRWWPYIAVGLLLSVAWAVVQRLAYTESGLPILGPVVVSISSMLSCTAEPPLGIPLAEARPHGLAYEPSWLASQVTLLLMPLGISLLVSACGWRRIMGGVAAGAALLGVALGSSRIGFATIFASGAGCVVSGGIRGKKRLVIAMAAALLCAGLGVALAWRSQYFQAVVASETPAAREQAGPPGWPAYPAAFGWVARTNFLPRVAAAHAAAGMAEDAPVAGVGLGLYALHFPAHAPAYAMQSAEVRGWADPDPAVGRMPNAKNMVLRLAAETGLIGLALWLAFIAWHWSRGWSDPAWRLLAVPAAIALLADWISLDSFALPQAWLLLAIVVACRPDEHPA